MGVGLLLREFTMSKLGGELSNSTIFLSFAVCPNKKSLVIGLFT